jgi:hypothetical protein
MTTFGADILKSWQGTANERVNPNSRSKARLLGFCLLTTSARCELQPTSPPTTNHSSDVFLPPAYAYQSVSSTIANDGELPEDREGGRGYVYVAPLCRCQHMTDIFIQEHTVSSTRLEISQTPVESLPLRRFVWKLKMRVSQAQPSEKSRSLRS